MKKRLASILTAGALLLTGTFASSVFAAPEEGRIELGRDQIIVDESTVLYPVEDLLPEEVDAESFGLTRTPQSAAAGDEDLTLPDAAWDAPFAEAPAMEIAVPAEDAETDWDEEDIFADTVSDAESDTAGEEFPSFTVSAAANAPVITTQPKAIVYVKTGETASFTVKATGTGLTYHWQVSADGGSTWKSSSADTANSTTFKVKTAAAFSGRRYRCVVKSSNGTKTVSDVSILSVLGILTKPKSQTVATGSTVKFTVKASGKGITYRWQQSTDKGQTWSNCSGSTKNKKTFSFTTKLGHSGRKYRCVVYDGAKNRIITSAASLKVMDPPKITGSPRSKTLRIGEKAQYTISTSGKSLTYQWQYRKAGSTSWKNYSGKTTSILTVKASDTNDGCLYRCVVKNPVGKAVSGTARLTAIRNELGTVEKYKGRTVVLSIFTNDANYSWDWNNQTDVNTYWDCLTRLKAAVNYLKSSGAKYGQNVEFIYDWSQDSELAWTATFDQDLVRMDAYYADVQANFLKNFFDPGDIKAKYDADNVVYMFFHNTPKTITDRSWKTKVDHMEFINIFVAGNDNVQPCSVYAHEMIHTFGAPDLYYANEKITQKYVDHLGAIRSSDIMYTVYLGDTVTNEFSQLDAYYVGLTSYAADKVEYELGDSEHF